MPWLSNYDLDVIENRHHRIVQRYKDDAEQLKTIITDLRDEVIALRIACHGNAEKCSHPKNQTQNQTKNQENLS